MRQFTEALKAYDHAISLDRTHAGAWDNKGQILQGMGRHAEANMAEKEALRLKAEA
jgi:tetratricopeptide (TPR) repeat protein